MLELCKTGHWLQCDQGSLCPLSRHRRRAIQIATHSPVSGAHINMLCEYDFSDEILQDTMGSLLQKWSPIRSSHFRGSINP